MKMIKKDKLAYSMCDIAANLSLLGAFQIVEDANTEMMGMLKLDGETCMREYGGMWVYVRNRIELRKQIHWMDEYVLECYISSIGGARLTIDTCLKTDDEIAVVSRAELCAIDIQTKRIRRANTVGVNENVISEIPEIDIRFNNSDFVPSELVDSVFIRSSDIDFNRHTNNISYVRYILNQYKTTSTRYKPIGATEIQYIGQTFEGDKLDIYRCGRNNYSIRCNGTIVANCTIETKKAKIKRLT